jgi:hypothetical protein
MKYKVGDRVYLRDDLTNKTIYGGLGWYDSMIKGQWAEIRKYYDNDYSIKEDTTYNYSEEMIDHEKTAQLSTNTPCFDQSDARESDLTKDNVNHPLHYTKGSYEVIDVITDVTRDMVGIEAVCVGNIIKYVARYKHKNGVEDLEKARWYLNKLIDSIKD